MTTDNTAHPAPTPAPVAVPEVEPNWLTRLPDQWEDEADQHTRDQEFGIAEGLHVAADELTRAIRENARPEPVVAPLPSEDGAVVQAWFGEQPIPSVIAFGAAGWRFVGNGLLLEGTEKHVRRWVRLVPEDDEDTVRVPREAVRSALSAEVLDRHMLSVGDPEHGERLKGDVEAYTDAVMRVLGGGR